MIIKSGKVKEMLMNFDDEVRWHWYSNYAKKKYNKVINKYFGMEEKEYKPVYTEEGNKLVFDPKTGMYTNTIESEDIAEGYEYKCKETWFATPNVVDEQIKEGVLSYNIPDELVSFRKDMDVIAQIRKEEVPMEDAIDLDAKEAFTVEDRLSALESKLDEVINMLTA